MSDDYESLPETASFRSALFAGAFAGIMEHSLMYPIDNIKTRIQASIHHQSKIFPKSIHQQSLAQSLSKVSSTQGLKSLWKGISAVIIGAGPAHAVYFGIYELFKKNWIDNHQFINKSQIDFNYYLKIAITGGIATASSEALMNPFDTIKQRMQLNSSFPKKSLKYNHNYSSVFKTIKYIYQKEGIKSFYYSYPTTLLMTVPFHSTNFLVYESMTSFLNPNNNYNPLVHCISGGLAGGLASAITTPLDCIKTILQTHNFTKSLESHLAINTNTTTNSTLQLSTRNLHQNSTQTINNFYSATKFIYNSNGLMGFTKGLNARIISNIPATAISWTSYEMAKFYLNDNHNQKLF